MHKIDVVIPESGSIIVLQDPKPVVADHIIQWHFHSYRKDIADVGIEFKDADANFFNVQGMWQNHFEINLQDRTWMWAKPHKQPPNTRKRKYTVIAWDKIGTRIHVLDPTIIIEDP